MTKNTPDDDVTGKEKIARNVLASWGGQLVFIASGFILPRIIDNNLGQEALGVWDFAWAIIAYFGLMQGGIGASVNRYVAKHRAAGDRNKVNEAVSSAMAVQITAGVLVLAGSSILAYYTPDLFGKQLGSLTHDAQWVIFLVGAGLAVQMFFVAFVGVMTAYHRWDLHNAINAGVYFLTATAMIVALLSGGGLISLALTSFLGTVVTELIRMTVALRIAPDLSIGPRHVRPSVIKTQLGFGGKMLLPSISRLLMNQTVNVLIMTHLGPAMLALFARSITLVRHVSTLIGKYAFILTPVASSIQSTQDEEELKKMFISTTRSSYYMTLPMVLALVVLGDDLIHLWMGEDYANASLIAILAAGHLFSIAHAPIFSFLMGLNFHGKPGLAQFIAALCVSLSAFVTLRFFDGGLLEIALVIVIPLMIADGLYMPWFACRRIGIPFAKYYAQVAWRPLLLLSPYIAALITIKLTLESPGLTVLAGFIAGIVTVIPIYWLYVLPEKLKRKIGRRIGLAPR